MRRVLRRIPFVYKPYRYFRERDYERRFAEDCYGCFRGVYQTFEEAIQSAPKTKSIGYNNTELAQDYQDQAQENLVYSYDYPVLFWLSSIFQSYPTHLNLFDFGGNIGIHCYCYEKYLNYPPELKWTVCDMPAIVKAGKELAQKRDGFNLVFTDKFEEASGKDLFLASGSIQYVENLSLSLAALPEKPLHLLLNRLPIYNGSQFVTLQNGGKVFYPSYVFNKAEFIDSLQAIGYELIDLWQEQLDYCLIPFHPDKSGAFFHGLYFKFKA